MKVSLLMSDDESDRLWSSIETLYDKSLDVPRFESDLDIDHVPMLDDRVYFKVYLKFADEEVERVENVSGRISGITHSIANRDAPGDQKALYLLLDLVFVCEEGEPYYKKQAVFPS